MFSELSLYDIIFYFFAFITIASAGVVVFSRNIVYAAFSLLFTFFGVAGIYVLLSADFLAITQVLVYVGGIMVLILFGVMLTNKVVSVDIKTGTMQVLPATILVASLIGIILGVFWVTDWSVGGGNAAASAPSTAPKIGEALITTYVLPFEVASVVLLVAIIGAAMIARKEKVNSN